MYGHLEGKSYVSPTRMFQVRIPVLPELGGSVMDTENVVTFQDEFNTHQTIACFQMDATQRWEHETRGRKDYLVWFFSNFVEADFEQRFPGARIESAHFMPNLNGGTLLISNTLPGGSMFAARLLPFSQHPPPVAKRGNLLFVKDEHVFVLSIELAERVLQRTTYDKTAAEEDKILHQRLLTLLSSMSFTSPPQQPAPIAKRAIDQAHATGPQQK